MYVEFVVQNYVDYGSKYAGFTTPRWRTLGSDRVPRAGSKYRSQPFYENADNRAGRYLLERNGWSIPRFMYLFMVICRSFT